MNYLTESEGQRIVSTMATATLPAVLDLEKIKQLREKLGLTQEQAAHRAGFKSRQAWFNIESGGQSPSLATLDKIAAALGVKARDLLK
jgi:transcriptional regulator with XRE-family HTH domain